MNIQIKKYIDPIKTFWANLTKKKKIIIISVLGGIVLLSVIAGILLNRQPYVVLYPGMDHTEAVEVMNELKDRDISYKEDNGTIMVPKDKENALRMELANEGYPKTAPNYDFFTNNVDIMSTDFEKKTIEKYQLNQRLEAVIKTLDCIKNANVTISIPDSSGYAWDENSETPTASVTVTLATGKTLESSQVNGIKQLVAKSVPNLKTDDVAVIDTATGNELNVSDTDGGNQVNISQFKLEIEKEYENDIEKSVLKVLTPLFGQNNVKVTAKSVMDVDKKVQEIITYNPSQDNKGVISESQTQKEQETGGQKTTGGAAGTESNTETTTYPGVTVNGDTIYTKDSESYKYLVSQVKQQIQGDAASVADMTISVAVNKEMMDDTQKQEIAKLAAYAAAIQPDKVAVYNAVFPGGDQQTGGPSPTALPLNQILIIGGVALLTLLIVILVAAMVARGRKKKKMLELAQLEEDENQEDASLKDRLEEEKEQQPEEEAIELQAIEDARAEKASKEQALTKEIQDFSSQNPEIAAQLIRSWLRGDDGNG
ncbi:flagellar basal-body MS-ring/collar protein FliF [Caproiciproducens sp. CPB-2]|uniref:flagellar basal-body MS-ring/collar protein FliF n=1 Tax=Caproiciproducens sp. CPB-2 TaxID=3030017 RepID=UPI0023DCE18D|nr:flagellar basal-body MS-ring/collar protein FliF [Caproiciproducens sp. CPB-2]MDF1494237.1 flagellar basal-body MS-ring/collar protein FliF [Caproiciproducens sp. CPB-2]